MLPIEKLNTHKRWPRSWPGRQIPITLVSIEKNRSLFLFACSENEELVARNRELTAQLAEIIAKQVLLPCDA